MAVSFIWWRKPDYPEKTTDLSYVIDKLYHIIFIEYRLVYLVWGGFELTTSVVIGTDYKGSCKFNYHTITTPPPNIDIQKIQIKSLIYLLPNILNDENIFGNEIMNYGVQWQDNENEQHK